MNEVFQTALGQKLCLYRAIITRNQICARICTKLPARTCMEFFFLPAQMSMISECYYFTYQLYCLIVETQLSI